MNLYRNALLFLLGCLFIGFSCKKKDDSGLPGNGNPPDSTTEPTEDKPPVDNTVPQYTVEWKEDARKISGEEGYAEYGRITRISGDSLLLTYHSGPNTTGDFFGIDISIRKSFDNGETWSSPEVIVDGHQPGYYGFQNPQPLVLKNGWIILAFVGRGNPDNNENDNVQICVSKDRGKTWSQPQIVAKGRSWEPGMVQLPDGTIDLFYSSEAAWFPSDHVLQEILLVKSTDDGLSWSQPRQVSFYSNARDGMPVPLILSDQKGLVFSEESVGNSQSPWIVWSSVEDNFDYPGYGTIDNRRRWLVDFNNIFGGAPYLLGLPSKETLLSMQFPGVDRTIGADWKKSTMAVLAGNSMATNFGNISYPWPDLPLDEGAYFSSLFLKNDSTVVLVTTRNFPDRHSEIWWKEGILKKKTTSP